MQKVFKYLLAGCAVFLALAIICLAGLVFWAKSPYALDWLEHRINASIPGEIAIERHRLSLIAGRLDIRQAVLKGPTGEPLAGFERFSLDVSWPDLLRRELRITDIRLEKPWTRLSLDREGRLNLLAAFPPSGSPQPPGATGSGTLRLPVNIVLLNFKILNGRAEFENPSTALKVAAGNLELSADGNLGARQGNLKLSVGDFQLTPPAVAPPTLKLELTASLDPTQRVHLALNLSSTASQLILKGMLSDLGADPALDLAAELHADLVEWQHSLGLTKAFSGNTTVHLAAKGRARNPDATLMLAYDGGLVQGQAVERADLALSLKDRRVTLESAKLQAAGGFMALKGHVDLKAAFAQGLLAAPGDWAAVAYQLDVDQQAPSIGPWVGRGAELSGSLSSRLRLTGQGIDPAHLSARLALDLNAAKLKAAGLARAIDGRLNLEARIERQTLHVQRLDAVADGARIRGNGRYGWDDRTLEGRLSVDAANLSGLTTLFGVETIKGAGRLELTAAGSLDRPVFELDLDARNLAYDKITLGEVQLKAGLRTDRTLQIKSLALSNQGSVIRASANVRLAAEGWAIDPEFANTLKLNLKDVESRDFMGREVFGGSLAGDLNLQGPAKALKGDLRLQGRRLDTAWARLGDLDARLRLDGGEVLIQRILLDNQGSALQVQGRIGLFERQGFGLAADPAFEIRLDAAALDAQDFIDSIKGRFSLQTDLSGTLRKPRGTLSLKAEKVDLGVQRLEAMKVAARIAGDRIEADALQVILAPGEEIHGRGWIQRDRSFDFNLSSPGFSLHRIDALKSIDPGQGKVHFDLAGHGSIQNPDLDGSLLVDQIRINDKPIDDFRLKFSLHDRLAHVWGNLNFGLDASYDLVQKNFRTRVDFDRTELGSYFKAAGIKDVHGALSGTLMAQGNAEAWKDIQASINLHDLQLFYQNAVLVQSDQLKASIAQRTLSIPGIQMALLSEGSLELKGSAEWEGPIDLAYRCRVPLQVAGRFVEALADATGSLALSGRLAGSFSRPDLSGRIDLADIGLTVPVLQQKVHDLKGRIFISRDSVRIESLGGFLDTGRFSVQGAIAHETLKLTEISLSLDVEALPLELPDTLSLLLNSRLALSGGPDNCQAKGEIVILEGAYFKDVKFNLFDAVSKPKRTVAPPSSPLTAPFLKNMSLDIAVRHRDALLIQNNLADLQLKPDLHVGGTLNNPVIDGRAQVQYGNIYFQKKTFEVQKGVIDFVNPYKTEATIDIVGQTQVRAWKITLTVEGSPDNLLLTLTSVPAESNADILSLLLFGKTGKEVASGQGAVKQSTGQIMAEMLADSLGEDLKKTTGVDILELEATDAADTEASGGLKVTVGKHLSERMTVKYSVETKDGETIQRAISEYKFLEHILASGFQDTQGVYGGELVFRIEFR